jgi:subtilisin-like proprotein convertase family protein
MSCPALRPLLGVALLAVSCVGPEGELADAAYPPLVPAGALLAGTPPAPPAGSRGKASLILPAKFDLLASQSPVKDQGQRGTCSYFSTLALVEHLYRAATPSETPVLSEQYAIWLVATKGKVSDSVFTNLEVYSEHGGLIEASIWPYSKKPWTAPAHPECDAASPPASCQTQGEPPAAAAQAKRWTVGSPDAVSTQAESLKAYLYLTKQALVVGMPVHCQAWSYATGCPLPTDSARYQKGFISYPTPEDLAQYEASSEQPSHAMLLVGWDDTLELPRRDGDGKPILDADGKPELERGFYLAKNSWGTNYFGSKSPVAPGYALIAMRYVEELGRLVAAQRPGLSELCGDALDNDLNGYSDCDDRACSDAPECAGKRLSFGAKPAQPLAPGATGESAIWIANAARVASLAVRVELSHPARHELRLELVREGHGTTTWTLFDHDGPVGADLVRTFPVSTAWGEAAARGKWTLRVVNAGAKPGLLKAWQIDVRTCDDASCPNQRVAYTTLVPGSCAALPDADPAGLTREVVLPAGLDLSTLSATLDLEHPRAADLRVTLQRVGGAEQVLLAGSGSAGAFEAHELPAPGLLGSSQGHYLLRVQDLVAGEVGSLCKVRLGADPL